AMMLQMRPKSVATRVVFLNAGAENFSCVSCMCCVIAVLYFATMGLSDAKILSSKAWPGCSAALAADSHAAKMSSTVMSSNRIFFAVFFAGFLVLFFFAYFFVTALPHTLVVGR